MKSTILFLNLYLSIQMLSLSLPFTLLAKSSIDTKSAKDYWKETALTLDSGINIFNKKRCYLSEQIFFACVRSLNTLGTYHTPKLKLVTTDQQEQGVIITKYNGLNLVSVSKESEDLSAEKTKYTYYKELKELKKAENDFYSKVYLTNKNISFSKIFTDLRKNLNRDAEEAMVTSQVLNTYLSIVLDPHTAILSVQKMYDGMHSNKQFSGIGVILKKIAKKIIFFPIEDGPAFKAGIKNNDILTHVNDKNISDKDMEEVASLIKGLQKTSVNLQILRNNKILKIDVIREKVIIKNVTYKVVKDTSVAFGYILLREFSKKDSCKKVSVAIKELEEKNVKALIIDLRNNPGGLSIQARCIAGLFLKKGLIIYQTSKPGSSQLTSLRNTANPETNLPIITLINARSASASEILSGALQDHKRAWLLGERSYGKGTEQSVVSIWQLNKLSKAFRFSPKTQQALKFKRTKSVFYQPNGTTNQLVGISPEFEVPSSPELSEEERFSPRQLDLLNYAAIKTENQRQKKPERLQEAKDLISSCSELRQIKSHYKEQKSSIQDYQLYYAQNVLYCLGL